MRRKQDQPDLAAQIVAKRAEHVEAKKILGTRNSQLATSEETARQAAATEQQLEQGRAELLVPARLDGNPAAQAQLTDSTTRLWKAERERRDAEATAVALRGQIAVATYKVKKTGEDLARLENRLGDEGHDKRMPRIREVLSVQLLPPVLECLDELAAAYAREGLPDAERAIYLKRQAALAYEIQEAIWQGTTRHKMFQRAWERPSRGDRSRIPDAPPADEMRDTIDAALAAAERADTTTH